MAIIWDISVVGADVKADLGLPLDNCHSPKGVSMELDWDHHECEYLKEQLALEDRFREMGERLEGWR